MPVLWMGLYKTDRHGPLLVRSRAQSVNTYFLHCKHGIVQVLQLIFNAPVAVIHVNIIVNGRMLMQKNHGFLVENLTRIWVCLGLFVCFVLLFTF